MPTDEQKVIVKFEAEVNKLTKELDRTKRQLDSFRKKADRSTKDVQASFKRLFAGAGIALAARQLAKYSDEYTNLSNRLRLATNSNEEFAKAQASVFEVAQDTRQSLAATAELYQRLEKSTKGLSLSQQDLVDVTETINKTLVISGASSQAAQAAIIQLGQGLAAGAVRGQEFNSITEQSTRLAQALADSLTGGDIGKLRKLAQEGGLTTQRVVEAIRKQAGAIDTEFSDTAVTIEQGFVRINNALTKLVGVSATATGASSDAAKALSDFADTISTPEVQEAFNALISVVARLGGVLAKLAGSLPGIGKSIGEGLANIVSGPANFEDVTRKIKQYEQELDRLDERIAARGGFSSNIEKQELARLEKELEKLRLLQELFRDDSSQTSVSTKPDSGAPRQKPIIDTINTESAEADKIIERLKEQIALYDKVGEAAKIRYQLENDLIKGVTGEQKQQLILLSEKLDALEKQKEFSDAVNKALEESLTSSEKQIKSLQENILLLTVAFEEGEISADQFAEAVKKIDEKIGEIKEKADGTAKTMKKFAERAAENIQDAFADFLFDPFEDGLKGMLNNFVQTLRRMAAEIAAQAILNQVAQSFSAAGSAGSTGSSGGSEATDWITAIGSIFSAFADGGRPRAGMPAIVGEEGPELFIPDSAGTIIPNDAMGGNSITIGSMVFPGVTNERDAKRAAGAAARQLAGVMSGAGRYS